MHADAPRAAPLLVGTYIDLITIKIGKDYVEQRIDRISFHVLNFEPSSASIALAVVQVVLSC